MFPLDPPFRNAEPRDAAVVARLVDVAGQGFPYRFWRTLAEPGEDPWEIGRRRQEAAAAAGKVVVVDEGNGPLAALTGYAIGDAAVPLESVPAFVRPLQDLENAALDSWYVNILAVLPEAQGRGLGSRLLDVAERVAVDAGLRRTSVIVADANAGARRLYARRGYVAVGSRAVATPEGARAAGRWVLLVKDLTA